MDILAAKVGVTALAFLLAQQITDLWSFLPQVGAWSIIGGAMVWAWRTTSQTQKDAFEVSKQAHDDARAIDAQIIKSLTAEIARLNAELDKK